MLIVSLFFCPSAAVVGTIPFVCLLAHESYASTLKLYPLGHRDQINVLYHFL
jgi:hypothetical protein